MRFVSLFTTLFLTSVACQAGYTEYNFLALSACDSFLISTDAVPPDVASPQASAEYKAYVAAQAPNIPSFWALSADSQSSGLWADCLETEKEIACTVIGQFRYSSFTCPRGQSKQWSRTCTTSGGQVGELKVYSVDTREYEDGGKPIVNQYMQADQRRFNAQCHKKAAWQ